MRKVLYIFGQLTDPDIEWLAKNGRRKRLPKGTILITQGVAVETLYIVLEGTLSVLKGPEKREIARMEEGEIAGEMSFVDSRPPSATVRAETNVVVYALSRKTLAAALEQNPAFGARFYKALATFISDRLRSWTDPESKDELDDSVLDNVDRAGARFKQLSRTLIDG
jgi:CRP-like cAMP-binding protein